MTNEHQTTDGPSQTKRHRPALKGAIIGAIIGAVFALIFGLPSFTIGTDTFRIFGDSLPPLFEAYCPNARARWFVGVECGSPGGSTFLVFAGFAAVGALCASAITCLWTIAKTN